MPINKLKTTSIEIDAVTADLIATGAITVADIADGEITAAKLHTTLDFSTKTFTMHNNHITQAMVTQHQGALSVTESQISDLQSYALASAVPTDSEIDTRADARITNALAGNVTITGNLTVNGTQTVLNTETLTVDDNIIVLNNNEAGTPSQNAGIEVERGTSDNVDIRWNETTDTWQFTNDGTTYTDIGSGGGASAYTIDTKTDNYTAVAGDLGKLIHFTSISADKTLTLTAASTLGAGWFCFVRYSAIASGAAGYAYKVIIDPNGSETIDGETTRKMKGGQTFQILCDGSNFHILSSDESRAFSHNVFYNGVGSHGQSFAQPEASGAYAIALGGAALSSGTGAVALGYDSKATGSHSFAGPNSTATGLYGVSLGIGSPAGTYSGARGSGSVAIGEGARASTSGSLAIGKASVSEGSNASAIGQSLASGQHAFAASIGSNSSSYGAQSTHSVAIGYHAYAHTEHSAMAIGYNAQSSSNMGISLGLNARSSLGQGAIALGQSNARGYNGLAAAIASNSTSYGSQHDNGVAIGYYAVTTAAKQIALGSSTAQVKISGAYTLPTADGASGQVLQTNGSGVLSFATAGGGGSATSAYAKFTYEISATVTSVSGADVNGNTLSYSAGNNVVEVFVNGVKQQEGSGKDYQATTGSSVVFTNNLYSGDLVDVVAYNMFDGGDFNFDGSGNLVFGDNKKAVFGAGNDLEIYWDGTHGRIANTAGGNLYLTAYQVNFGDDVFFAGASYDAFWDRSVNSFRFNDSAKAVFGTDSDLIIQHDGSRSIIQDNGTGNLRIQANNLELKNADNTHDYIFCANGGAVELYHNNSAKLYTQSHGVRIDGGLRFASSGSESDTSNPYIYRTSGADNMVFATQSTERMRVDSTGNVGIGTTNPAVALDVVGDVAVTSGTDAKVTINDNIGEVGAGNLAFQASNSSGSALKPLGFRGEDIRFATGSAERLRIEDTGIDVSGSVTADTQVKVLGSNASSVAFSVGDAGTGWYNAGSNAIALSSNGTPSIWVTSGGNIGIGTNSPDDKLEISRTSTDQTVGLTLTNEQAGGYGSGIVFKSKRTDTGAVFEAAEIRVQGENSWNGLGNVGSQIQFASQKDGTLTQHMVISKNGYVGIGQTSPSAPLHITPDGTYALTSPFTFSGGKVSKTPIYTEYQYTWSGQATRQVDLRCASYHMAEVTYTSHQTNGGSDIHRLIKGKWANNHTTHTWTTYHDSGNTWGISLTITATDQSGSSGGSANGRLRIRQTYSGGSYSHSTLTLRVYYDAFQGIDLSTS